MSKICWFQLLKYEDLLFFYLLFITANEKFGGFGLLVGHLSTFWLTSGSWKLRWVIPTFLFCLYISQWLTLKIMGWLIDSKNNFCCRPDFVLNVRMRSRDISIDTDWERFTLNICFMEIVAITQYALTHTLICPLNINGLNDWISIKNTSDDWWKATNYITARYLLIFHIIPYPNCWWGNNLHSFL